MRGYEEYFTANFTIRKKSKLIQLKVYSTNKEQQPINLKVSEVEMKKDEQGNLKKLKWLPL